MLSGKPPPLRMMDRLFANETSSTRFVLKSLILSGVALLIFLFPYISLRSGFWDSLIGDPVARGYLLRQILTGGLPIVFVINHIGFTAYAGLGRPGTSTRRAARALAADLPTRFALFFIGHGAIYAASARLFGSFGGDAIQALGAVGPTIALAAGFGNLSGVYLYATAISSYPLFLAAALELMEDSPRRRRIAGSQRLTAHWPRRIIAGLTVLFVLFYVLFAIAISAVAGLF